jgi:hypothetical protein
MSVEALKYVGFSSFANGRVNHAWGKSDPLVFSDGAERHLRGVLLLG